jgi:hypothetical protein
MTRPSPTTLRARNPSARAGSSAGQATDATTTVFWILCTVFAAAILFIHREMWFVFDDWLLLGYRSVVLEQRGVVAYLLEPHNGHMMAGSIGLNLLMINTFGMSSYLPLLICVIGGSVLAAWVVRRAAIALGASAWTAALCAPLLIIWTPFNYTSYWLFENIFLTAPALAMVQLFLTDHHGRLSHRDWLGALVATGAVTLHSVGVIPITVTVIGLTLRRRFRAATVAATPLMLLAIWAAWFPTVGETQSNRPTIGTGFDFAMQNISNLARFGQPWPMLFVIATVGTGSLISRRSRRTRRITASLLISAMLCVGAFTWSRAAGAARFDAPPAGRYLATVGVLIAPIAIVGIGWIALQLRTRWPQTTAALTAVLFVMVAAVNVVGQLEERRKIGPLAAGFRSIAEVAIADHEADDSDFAFDHPFFPIEVGHIRGLVARGWLSDETS